MLAVCTLLATSCFKDEIISPVAGGVPVTAELTVAIPASEDVPVTRGGSSHSEVAALDIFVYDKSTGAFESTAKATLSGGTLDGMTRKYTVSFPATTGSKTLLAIANGEDMSEWAADMAELREKRLSLQDMKAEVIKLQKTIVDAGQLPGFTALRMLLIGEEDVTINGGGNGKGTITGNPLVLRRAAVEVSFEIINGNAPDIDGSGILVMDFNPSTYTVFNVPAGTQIGSGEMTPETVGYYNTAAFVVPPKNNDMYSFTFYMPENILPDGSNTDYNGREEWGNSGDDATPPDQKQWTNAPEYSTFVVITGAFNAIEKADIADEFGVLKETGRVSYTIHLGDFSTGPGATGSIDNYSVERNCSYKYKVTVNGVNNIIAEAEKRDETDWQNAAEGGVIQVGQYTQDYTLDAHYEQVFLEYNITEMAADIVTGIDQGVAAVQKEISERLLMIVETPFTGGARYISPYGLFLDGMTEDEDMMYIDYKWVEFFPQEGNANLSLYPGQGVEGTITEPMVSAYQLCLSLGQAIFDFKKNGTVVTGTKVYQDNEGKGGITIIQDERGHYVARFTAFVDEYYYKDSWLSDVKIEWDEFVNTDMRRMMLAMDVQISDDKNSQSVKLYSNISQRSIQTFYDLTKAQYLDGFGIEAFNETPGTGKYGTPVNGQYGTSMGNGYQNTIRMLGGSINDDGSGIVVGGEWADFVNLRQNGYMTSNTSTDPVASHKIENSQPEGEEVLAFRACMSRNRDLDGDGDIDPDEIRWYMPSVHEYIRIALGSGAIASESQLYHGQKSELTGGDGYVTNHTKDASIYYTSTSDGSLSAIQYWTVERGSYSPNYGYTSAIRCIRHLPNPDGSAVTTPDPFYTLKKLNEDDGGNYMLDYTGILQSNLLRQTRQSGGYKEHNEDDPANRFYKGMVVAKDYLREGVNNTGYVRLFTFEDVITGDDVCAGYSEKSGGADIGEWRVPNQSELTSLTSRPDLFFPDDNIAINGGNIFDTNHWGVLCRTQFSNPVCRIGFSFRGKLLSCPQSDQQQGGVRCVRDATDAEMEAASVVN